ncbi:GHMP kinase [Arenibacter sp. 6A1]|uniref:GYDIA family GHMP kinase n=1 Tax=Arenibacter sp. 6A1 TaxID=2720391 RepID=UPI0014460B52|nr:GYDIA family GHMP kinase [Arenibacter sp. 6A1]NKI26069.1 GHMP kinase [Arenibacter sp. 6A1]
MKTEFYSNGKLLITGEYAVLDGAESLAIPTIYGQSLGLKQIEEPLLAWRSLDEKGNVWFQGVFELETLALSPKESDYSFSTASSYNDTVSEEKIAIATTLSNILKEARNLNPDFLAQQQGYEVTTSLNFPRNWGLGTSSTLINNIASWANVNAYSLLWNSFSGSGYDIACAQHHSPITYKLTDNKPQVKQVSFNPSYKNSLYFVYLNQKQNSREGIAAYKSKDFNKIGLLSKINNFTQRVLTASSLSQFEKLLKKHEEAISEVLEITPIKERLFPDFKGAIKSLGAWGGDFILVTGNKNTPDYFKNKGYSIVIPYSKMVK